MPDRINHAATAEGANREAMRRGFWASRRWHRKAQVHATLAVAEQLRIANLIALGGAEDPATLSGVGDGAEGHERGSARTKGSPK